MTIRDLEQLAATRREIGMLEQRLRRMSRRETVSDSVKGSSPEFPYAERIVKVEGLAAKPSKAAAEIRRTLAARKKRLEEKVAEVERALDAVTDSAARQGIELHYVEGMTWEAAAARIWRYPCGDRLRKRVELCVKNIF